MGRPGPLNLLTDVGGLAVGHAVDEHVRTGVTVILPERRVACSVDVRGGGSGTRETDLLRPEAAAQAVDAVCLAGGSAFGLDAAAGMMPWLARRRRGFDVHGFTIPIIPAAILFDLHNGGDKEWGDDTPYRRLGREACDNAGSGRFALGNAGAGFGAAAGKLKGGLGSASWIEADGLVVAALMIVNSVGSVLTPDHAGFWAAPYEQQAEFGGRSMGLAQTDLSLSIPAESRIGGNTCIGLVATNAILDKTALRQVAAMAHDGLARAVRPIHTPFDGDAIFALATAAWQDRSDKPLPWLVARVGSIAADCVARAVGRGVWEAQALGHLRSARELMPKS